VAARDPDARRIASLEADLQRAAEAAEGAAARLAATEGRLRVAADEVAEARREVQGCDHIHTLPAHTLMSAPRRSRDRRCGSGSAPSVLGELLAAGRADAPAAVARRRAEKAKESAA
jgi:hypothetical protein